MKKFLRKFNKKNEIKSMVKDLANQEHQGAVAFEYIIILVIMAVAIFTAWRLLADAAIQKAREIADFISNNGQNPLGTGN